MILANEKQAHYDFYIAERIPLGKEIYADWPTLNSLRLVASYRINTLVPKAERTPNIEFVLHADNGVEIKIYQIFEIGKQQLDTTTSIIKKNISSYWLEIRTIYKSILALTRATLIGLYNIV